MPVESLRVVFAGTPEFAAIHLQALLDAGINVVAVYSQPDRPAGRGKKLQASPVKQLAEFVGIPVLQPERLQGQAEQAELAMLAPDVMVVVAYGLLLPQAVLDIPVHGCINVHGSLLPRWRGAAPIQRAIEAGDAETGVGIMQMEAGLDTGSVILEARLPIMAEDTGQTVHDKLAALGCKALLEALTLLASGRARPVPQPQAGVCYAHKLSKEDARLDFNRTAPQLHNQVRAFNPFPVAWCELPDGNRLRVWQAEPVTLNAQPPAGTVLEISPAGVLVACGSGGLRLTSLQLPDRKRLSVHELLNGKQLPLTVGDQLR